MHITGDVRITGIYMDVSVYWPLSVLCMFCVCDIKSEYHIFDI